MHTALLLGYASEAEACARFATYVGTSAFSPRQHLKNLTHGVSLHRRASTPAAKARAKSSPRLSPPPERGPTGQPAARAHDTAAAAPAHDHEDVLVRASVRRVDSISLHLPRLHLLPRVEHHSRCGWSSTPEQASRRRAAGEGPGWRGEEAGGGCRNAPKKTDLRRCPRLVLGSGRTTDRWRHSNHSTCLAACPRTRATLSAALRPSESGSTLARTRACCRLGVGLLQVGLAAAFVLVPISRWCSCKHCRRSVSSSASAAGQLPLTRSAAYVRLPRCMRLARPDSTASRRSMTALVCACVRACRSSGGTRCRRRRACCGAVCCSKPRLQCTWERYMPRSRRRRAVTCCAPKPARRCSGCRCRVRRQLVPSRRGTLLALSQPPTRACCI